MAVSLDINRGHISDIELGKREVEIITLQVIVRGLNTSIVSENDIGLTSSSLHRRFISVA